MIEQNPELADHLEGVHRPLQEKIDQLERKLFAAFTRIRDLERHIFGNTRDQ